MRTFKVEQLERAFLEGMVVGYVVGGTPTDTPDLPGWKQIITKVIGTPAFELRDAWTTNGDYSSGFTTLSLDGEVLWIMHYGGYYEQDAHAFLKTALHEQYFNGGIFNGGRGPDVFETEDMLYINDVKQPEFIHFHGKEQIVGRKNGKGHIFGQHWYHGQALIPLIN